MSEPTTTSEPLLRALNRMRSVLLDPERLVKAVASGRQRGTQPAWRRAELRYVDLKSGTHLQITTYDETQAFTSNHLLGDPTALDDLLEVPFANWHVDTVAERYELLVTKPTTARVRTTPLALPAEGGGTKADAPATTFPHDQAKQRLLPEDDPVFVALGLSDKDGRLKPSRQAKYRQVEEFLRHLATAIDDARTKGRLRTPTAEEPLRIVDLGCGNGYLTFAAQRYLTEVRGLPVVVTGVDVKEQSARHNTEVASRLAETIGHCDAAFVVGTIDGVELETPPDVVLALHACDTATDDALARAIAWEAPLVLAAPCCHHDIAAQLRRTPTPSPYAMITRHGILRERFADTMTDAVRASLLRLSGYKVDVVQFVESQHTPRNTLLRAVRASGPVTGGSVKKEYDELVATWGIRPKLGELLGL
ncbi:SAM-dependent methyltransferase [Nocardioides sp. BP30]|uniref:class I SAM-dependent methyltransferase n=1 Tax=Nocardioides sp. BP30 TaxID=3036374 RepID=UPI0024683F5C|nr:SAM-dependent methyltransferase [Nocardioides sp. BP30]WGL51993.1 SAM-dependent methyltransferase [Nocardioides sp. BP30]